MIKNWKRFILVGSLILILAACAGSGPDSSPAPASPSAQGTTSDLQEEASPPDIDAASLFSSNCARCHGADRSGGSGPALLPDQLTKGQEAYINIITNGSGPMPAWGSRLSPEEISALVDFILTAP